MLQLLRPPSFLSSRFLSSLAESETKWIFPANREMAMNAEGHKHGYNHFAMCSFYNTAKPLKIEHVEQALHHLQRLLPNFSCTMRKRGEQLWACELPNEKLDFKVLKGVSVEDVIDDFINNPFNFENEPICKYRLIPLPDDSPSIMPDIKDAFPHQYTLMRFGHHSFNDGITESLIAQATVDLINDVIAGRPIEGNEPLGILVSDEDISKVKKNLMEELRKDPVQLEAKRHELVACDSSPILFKAFPPPGGTPATKFVSYSFKSQTIDAFMRNCRRAGVTFNSGFEALINTALVEMVRDAGVNEEFHNVSVQLSVDIRRFKKTYGLPVLGLHSRRIAHQMKTKVNTRDHFWDYTWKLHGKLSDYVRSGEALKQEVVRQMTMPQISPEEHFRGTPRIVRDYGLSNLGNIAKFITGEREYLRITDMRSSVGVKKANVMMVHLIYSLRECTPYSISYNTSYMSNETAKELIERIVYLLNKFSH